MPATKKKDGVPTMRVMIATACFLLATLAVLYSDGSGSPGVALMVYDPIQDYCFEDKANLGKYCWGRINEFPYGHWKGVNDRGSGDCGEYCYSFIHH